MFIGVKKSAGQKLSFSHATRLLDLIYVPTKMYHLKVANMYGSYNLHKISASGEIST